MFVDKKLNITDLLSVDISNALVVIPGYYDDRNGEMSIVIYDNKHLIGYFVEKPGLDRYHGTCELMNICDTLNSQIKGTNIFLTIYQLLRDNEYSGFAEYVNSFDDYETAHILFWIYGRVKRNMSYIDSKTYNSCWDDIFKQIYRSSNLYKKDVIYLQKYIDYEKDLLSSNIIDDSVNNIIKKDLLESEIEDIINNQIPLLNDVQKYGVFRNITKKYMNTDLTIQKPYNLITKQIIDRKLLSKISLYNYL